MDITSANSSFSIVVPLVFPVPVEVQGYASDEAFMADAVESAEARIGVDGKMSAGFTPYLTKQTITLQADSPSVDLFETWVGAQSVVKQLLPAATAALAIPALAKTYIFTKGALTRVTPFPAGKKVLQPVVYEITWELCQAMPIG